MLHIFNDFRVETFKSERWSLSRNKKTTFQLNIAELKSGDLHYLLYF